MNDQSSSSLQFRLITLIGVVTFAAITVRLFVALPAQVINLGVFVLLAAGLLWMISATSAVLSWLWQTFGRSGGIPAGGTTLPCHARLLGPLRYSDPMFGEATPYPWTVVLATISLVVLCWRPIRLAGQFFSGVPTFYGTESFSSYLSNSWNWSDWVDPGGWKMNLVWQAGSHLHWWLHFAILGIPGLCAIALFGCKLKLRDRLKRFFLFAPWIALLDLMLLFASWMLKPTTVPEPSTGFVVGIFRWELWQWDCWQDSFWLLRASAPCWLVTAVFFRHVFDFGWQLSAFLGLLCIPMAIAGCIAWTVLFGDVIGWLAL